MASGTGHASRRRAAHLALTAVCIGLGLLLVVQLRTQVAVREAVRRQDWAFAVVDLVEANAHLREEIKSLQAELAELQATRGGGPLLQSMVDEVNYLRIANGLVAVSGPGVELLVSGPVSALDLYDLMNELRNAGAEALALNGQRVVAWSAITTDGKSVIIDGHAIDTPYRLQAIGDAQTLEGALLRPGGLVTLLSKVDKGISVTVQRRDKLTLPIYGRPVQIQYARPLE